MPRRPVVLELSSADPCANMRDQGHPSLSNGANIELVHISSSIFVEGVMWWSAKSHAEATNGQD
jgi:hypothetical protein